MRNIYILSSCNAWKERASREIILVTTSISKLREELKKQIEGGGMEVGNSDMYHAWLNGAYLACSHEQLDSVLKYGMLEVWED